jgi:hypothetical protein
MSTELGPIVATLKGETKDFEQAMRRSNSELLALGAGSVAMGNIATQAFNYLAAGAINAAGTLHRWAEEAAGAAEKTQILSMKMGIGQATLEGWGAALKRVGLDQEALAGGMKMLSKHIEGLASGSEKSVELFGKLNTGLSNTELASLGTEQAIRLIADRFAGMSDGAEKAALSQQLLGRAGLQLIPVLNEGSAGLDKASKDAEKFGLVLTETQRGALLKYDDSLDNLSLALEGFKKQVAAAFAPSLTRTIEMMTSAVSYAKSIFTEFANAAEKLFIRFGAIAAVIEIVGKQIFSLSVLNKEAWEQTLQQVDAIDKWAAAEIKAVDATKNASVEMETAKTITREYTVSQKTLGEQIVAYTQIQVKAHQDAKQAVMDRIAAEIELGQRQKAYAAEVSKQVFGEIFEAEERRMKDAYAGSSVMIDNITTKLKALRDMHEDIQKGLDASTKAYIDEAMAADAALVAQTKAEVEADQKNEQYQGAWLVRQEQARQAMQFGWKDVFGSMSQSAQFAFGQIRASFGNAIVGLAQGTANWKQFWDATQGAILNSAVQWGIDVVGTFIAKNAAILATESITASGVVSIWTATSAAVTGAFGMMTGAIATFFTATIIPMFAAVGEAVMGFLAAIATSLDISIFGAPFSIPVWAAVGVIAAAVGVLSAFAFGAFAEGGIITKPTMALMGEAGPEAVIPLSKLGQLNGGGQTTVVVELDGRTLARSVFDNMPSVMRIRGVSA